MPPGEPIEPGDEPDEAMATGADRFEHYLDALLGGGAPVARRCRRSRRGGDGAPGGGAVGGRRSGRGCARSGLPGPAAAAHAPGRSGHRHRSRSHCRCDRPARRPAGSPSPVASCCRPASSGRRAWRPARPASSCCRPDSGRRSRIWDDGTAWSARDGEWVEVASVSDVPVGSAVRFSTPAFDGYVVNDRRPDPRAQRGLYAHGLHAPVPPGLERPAMPVPRRQLRPDRRRWPTAVTRGVRRGRIRVTRAPTRSSCRTWSSRRSRSTATGCWSGRRARHLDLARWD